MSKYDMVFILDSRSSDGEKVEIAKQVTDLVTKFGGVIESSGVWLDRQRMAFALKKTWEGVYYLTRFELKGAEVARLRRELLINERVLRFLIVKADNMQAVAA